MPKISVIIPVYNSEKHLKECLESVNGQILKDIEIICINDCSCDKSFEILNDYKNIKVINLKENSGAGYARNRGIEAAKGEYIGFVDSDDIVAPDFFEKLYTEAVKTNADAIKGNIYDLFDGNVPVLTDFYDMNDKIRKNKHYFYYGFTSAIYNRNFININNIRFDENVRYFEDPYFSIKCCLNYKKLSLTDDAKYFYRRKKAEKNANCLTKQNFKDFKISALNIIELLNETDIKKDDYLIIYDFLYNYAVSNFYNVKIESSIRELLFDTIAEILFAGKYDTEVSKNIFQALKESAAKGKYYDLLLKYYKKYDYLNKEKNTVKIFVSYIKPSFLFKSDILTPIHLGRSVERYISKDGEVTDEDILWLHNNCIGDDDFDGNISKYNRRIGFLTGTYKAYKNYEEIGNPEYFGSMGYRKLLFPSCLENIGNFDLILPKKTEFKISLKEQFVKNHGNNYFKLMLNAVQEIFPEETNDLNEYFKRNSGYFAELYIMKKPLFFKFCEDLFKFTDYLLKICPDFIEPEKDLQIDKENKKIKALLDKFTQNKTNKPQEKNKDLRDLAFIIERFSGYYLYKLTFDKNIKYKEINVFEPEVSPIKAIEYKKIVLEQMRKNIIRSMK